MKINVNFLLIFLKNHKSSNQFHKVNYVYNRIFSTYKDIFENHSNQELNLPFLQEDFNKIMRFILRLK